MATQASRRNTMTLFTAAEDMYCHHVRIVLAEKGIAADWVQVNAGLIPEEVYEVNPYGSLPTLIDRDLSLYQSDIILEYLDERFPHPPLLPVYPVARAQARQMLYRIRRDWFSLVTRIEANAEGTAEARRDLRESLLSIAPLFDEQPFFMSDEFSLLDCYLAALLWRLPKLGIELQGPAAKSVKSYMIRVFERDGFQQSLTEKERRMRADW